MGRAASMPGAQQSLTRLLNDSPLWKFLLGVLTVVFLLVLVSYHLRLIKMPIPLDYYEGTMPAITAVLAEVGHLYTWELQPEYAYVYTPLYNYIAAPVSRLLGNTLFTHRLISAFFIYASLLLVFLAAKRTAGSSLAGFSAAGIALAAFLFYSTPVASTNSTGLFFFLATVIIPWLFNFSTRSLLLSALCGALAFFSKQYFVVGLAFVSIGLFLNCSIKKSFYFTGGAFALLLVSVALYSFRHPYFLDNTIFAVAESTDMASSGNFIAMQLFTFGKLYVALIAMAVPVLFLGRNGNALASSRLFFQLQALQWRSLQLPFLKVKLPYFLLCFVLATAVIIFSLGKNQGNYMTYLFQLMTPFFVITCIGYLYRQQKYLWLLVPLLAIVYLQTYLFLPRNFAYAQEPWTNVNDLIESHDNMLLSPILIASASGMSKPIRTAGHTFYFKLAQQKPGVFLKARPQERVKNIWERYIHDLYRDIEEKKFDLIILNKWDILGMFGPNPPPGSSLSGRDFLRKHYRVVDRIKLSMTDRPGGGTYTMQVYVPKTSQGRL